MAARYIEEVRAVQPSGPYHLCGWSLGGVIAFEMARQLLARGESVAPVALLDSRIPAADETAAGEDGARLLADFAHDLGLSLNALGIDADRFVKLEESARLDFVLGKAKGAGLVPSYVTLEMAGRLFEVYRANRKALLNYDPRPAPCRALLFKAAESVWPDDNAGVARWERVAGKGVETCQAGGDHYTMLRAPHVEALAARLAARLAAGERVSG
jgi:thioesterase domain-containing protein